ncbi:MAG: nitroreductase family protein [Patescibacteria group bacterium]|nr:nitroreductase family protein [Patescibacteria group bacterium]
MVKEVNGRTTEYPINDIFLKRYSPRAFSGEAISKEELMTLFEAARFAPSGSNVQPWRFIYAMRESPEFHDFLMFLTESNREWCAKAGALVVTISKTTRDNGVLSKTNSFDAGLTVENLLLQATELGLYAHPMAGIVPEVIKEKLNIPDEYKIEMMIAIGKPGKVSELSERNRIREKPSDRKPLSEIVFEGKFSV